jgi:phosphoserine phosphatase
MNRRATAGRPYRLKEVDWSRSRSYGDSFDDLLALEIAGDRVAVNPESRLLDYALENNWRVLA